MSRAPTRCSFGVRIPLRDGSYLVANLYRPDTDERVPGLVCLTPYGADYLHPDASYYAARGFATLAVDVRGRGDSPGAWTMYGEAEDGADCVAFLAAQPFCTGRIGLYGASYSGINQWLIAGARPPNLCAIAPIAAPIMGVDGKISNGIPWPYNLRWMTLTARHGVRFSAFGDEAVWRDMFWRHYQSGARFADLAAQAGEPLDVFGELARNMFDPDYWRAKHVSDAQLDAIDIPVLTISGISDDCLRGALVMAERHKASASPTAADHRIVIGPWNHAGNRMPPARPGEDGWRHPEEHIARQPARAMAADFYAHHLAGADRPDFLGAAATVFIPGREQWVGLPALDAGVPVTLFLSSSATLSPDPGEPGTEHFSNDPADDRFARLEGSGAVGNTWAAWCGAQPFEDGYARHLLGAGAVFLSAPFAEPLTLLGAPTATLYLELDVPDADLVITLAELQPDGVAVTLSTDLMRLRYRNGLAAPSLLGPGVHRITFDRFRFAARRLLAGSRLRVVVRAINSIHYQRNMHSGGDLREETLADARVAHFVLHHGGDRPSQISFRTLS